MNIGGDTFYNEEFYRRHEERSYHSAQEILKVVFNIYRPESIVDFGCGLGTWLAAAESLGVKKLFGVDGDWVKKNMLRSSAINFTVADFENSCKYDGRFDMAMSLEVAEHIPDTKAREFVDMLCGASDIVVFSAAIRNQGGTNHINEQWQSYWINLFAKNGFRACDIIRSKSWNNEQVEWWYRQNAFLFVKEGSDVWNLPEVTSASEEYPVSIADVAHPDNYEYRISLIETECKKYCELQDRFRVLSDDCRSKDKEIVTLWERAEKEHIEKKRLITSKSFRLGNLFFRSIRNPYKMITFPFNAIRVLLSHKS